MIENVKYRKDEKVGKVTIKQSNDNKKTNLETHCAVKDNALINLPGKLYIAQEIGELTTAAKTFTLS